MYAYDRSSDCCGSGCFDVRIKFDGSELRKIGVYFTTLDNMSADDLLDKIPDMMNELGRGKGASKTDQVSGDGLFFLLTRAFDALKNRPASRENSLALTNLEQAMMWFNKDRAINGEISKTETHVELEDEE